ncbi:MAG: YggS family pyridoxal phosphate-dependent enzyme [Lachnospiraceae bacterium]|nr:YggS family pyridoxal phosphate-dependent enzyme [Lachnospiraceae bacterium]
MIKENLNEVRKKIDEARARAGRNDDVTLIAVSKTKPVSMLREAYDAGVRDFGENKVQEIVEKYPELPDDIRWHLIGHLQTNKVKYIIDKVCLIHSVDTYKLAEEISRQAVKHDVTAKILIEVNVAEEESKFGVKPEETLSLCEQISTLPNIEIHGLMTVAPYVSDPEENRAVFCALRELLVDIAGKNIDNVFMDCLSMGMSGDYTVAVEEGASYVRVGTSIFGQREYKRVEG